MADPATEERVVRNPVPSLLRSLMTDHLDPGYAAASARKASAAEGNNRTASRLTDKIFLAVGVVLVGGVFGVAAAHAAGAGSDASSLHNDALAGVRDAEERSAVLDAERQSLVEQVDSARATALRDDSDGVSVLGSIDYLESAAGIRPAVGPGITVTVGEPPPSSDLSDVSKPARGRSEAVVLDRDLQVLVNSLWVSGAEAVSVDGVRIGPGVTIRQAGGAMLVDNRPVFSPYRVSALGSPDALQTRFAISDAYLRMSALTQLYRVVFGVQSEEDLTMPAAAPRTIRTAVQGGR